MIILVSYTMTESTVQRISCCKRKLAPESQCQVLIHASTLLSVLSLSLSVSSLSLAWLLHYQTVQWPRPVGTRRLRPQAETPAPLFTSCPLGRVQSPHPENMGPGGCSRQLFGNDTMREFLGNPVSTCGCGGDDAAHVVLAAYTALCADVNHAKSQSDAPCILLFITIFFSMISDSTKLFSLCSIFLPFIWCPYECL